MERTFPEAVYLSFREGFSPRLSPVLHQALFLIYQIVPYGQNGGFGPVSRT